VQGKQTVESSVQSLGCRSALFGIPRARPDLAADSRLGVSHDVCGMPCLPSNNPSNNPSSNSISTHFSTDIRLQNCLKYNLLTTTGSTSSRYTVTSVQHHRILQLPQSETAAIAAPTHHNGVFILFKPTLLVRVPSLKHPISYPYSNLPKVPA
jgi:hypothetical protein